MAEKPLLLSEEQKQALAREHGLAVRGTFQPITSHWSFLLGSQNVPGCLFFLECLGNLAVEMAEQLKALSDVQAAAAPTMERPTIQ